MDRLDLIVRKLGDKVKWTSQAGGYFRTKHGVVVGIVPNNELPKSEYINIPFHGETVCPRLHKSYVVAVRVGRSSQKLYWPRVSQLEADS